MEEPLRVLFLFTILNRGGSETMVMNYYRHIDRSKVQFDFIVHREESGAYEDEIEQLGGRIYRMIPLRPWKIPQYKRQIRQFFDEHPGYRIIHGLCSELGYFIYREAAKRGIPVIIAHAQNSRAQFDWKWPFRWLLKHLMRPYLTHNFTCGPEAARWLFGKHGAQTSIFLPNAINTSSFKFDENTRKKMRTDLSIDDNNLVIGHVGRFDRQKNHPFLLKVFIQFLKQHPNSLLLLVGSGGSEETSVKCLVRDLHLEQSVRFLGSRTDIPHLLCAMDFFLFPSYMEGLGVAFVEAQCSGLPCLVSEGVPQCACMTDLVTRLSLKDNPIQWAKAINHQFINLYDRSVYANIIAEAGYDVSKNAQWLQNFYLSCLH